MYHPLVNILFQEKKLFLIKPLQFLLERKYGL